VQALHETGRSIPGDVRVITRYNGLRARLSSPPLTAVDLDLDAVARQAVALMLGALTGESSAPLPAVPWPKLMIRSSTSS
jgi:DNA-binding LacI/PurR family transcriptional regulator